MFPSAGAAQNFFNAAESQWKSCTTDEVSASLGYENAAGYRLGNVRRDDDVISVAMATNGGENGPDACQHSLGVRWNVVVEARGCAVPNIVSTYDPNVGWPKNPSWASPYAERIAKAMLENVK
ncbi:sensor domain-containing protein [Mycobacterium sp. 1274761.0]|uniref:sensor domain-containing protein n=1 Tax=Mycobacterium sp. 1274761.0 TaxID=1834077 RepID=UPI000801A8EF|nr:sensor domain-containing protein [Mycobacterium sp. 1274761.0]OBK79302.1 hypothetical protein A5651_24235 [Mycobacterium sp. 1274761.0]